MKKKLKDNLKMLYEAPPPAGKREFLRQMHPWPVSTAHILYTQISYISKPEWMISGMILGMVVFTSTFLQTAVFGVVLAFMPYLAAAGISESMRSVTYGMEELEMAARFSLKSIILARMCIVGLGNFALALCAALFIEGDFIHTMIYLLVPYLITVYGSLLIVRNTAVKEGLYVCFGFSAAVSFFTILYSVKCSWIYQERFLVLWTAVMIMLLIMNGKESRLLLKRMECY